MATQGLDDLVAQYRQCGQSPKSCRGWLREPAPQPIPSNGICSVATLGQNGTSETFVPTNYKNPHVIAWNFSVQQALPFKFTADFAYVGNHGVDMGAAENINADPRSVQLAAKFTLRTKFSRASGALPPPG